MRVYDLSSTVRFSRRVLQPLYETYLTASYSGSLVAYYPLGDSASPAVDISSNGYNSVGVGSGVTFATSSKISNTQKNSVRLDGTSAQTYIQLESSPGSRFRVSNYTIAIWFKRMGAGNVSPSGTGTGGILAEPLVMKGGAESETAGVNMNWGFGLEQIDSTYYLSADFEKKTGADNAGKPVGRNARMLDVSTSGTTVTLRGNTTASAPAVNHNFSAGERVRFGGTAISGITAGTWYYVRSILSSTTFDVSSTAGGSAISLGTVAAGGGAWCNHAKNSVTMSSSDSNWHFAANTWDGTNLKTYLDGVLSENETPTMTPPEDTSTQLAAIGAYVTSAGAKTGAFNGFVQHCSIWNTAFTSQQILDLYNTGSQFVAAPLAAAPSATLIYPIGSSLPTDKFVIQLSDAISVDDSSVVSNTVVLKKDGVTLSDGVDYTFSYDNSTDRVTLTTLNGGGTFPVGSYQIILN